MDDYGVWNKKHTGNKWHILPLVVFICGIIILHAIVMEVNRMDYEKIRAKASLNAVTYADQMINDFNLGIGKHILLNSSL